jgi:hypothetical protein
MHFEMPQPPPLSCGLCLTRRNRTKTRGLKHFEPRIFGLKIFGRGRLGWVALIAIALGWPVVPLAQAHPGAINLYINSEGALAPLPGFDPGGFILFPGIELSSQTPTIGVSLPTNGVASGARLDLEISQGLLYWDGMSVITTPRSLRIEAPVLDNEGRIVTGARQAYVVNAASRVQRGMTWGTYSGNNAWESEGLYFLDSLAAPTGIYGLVFRMTSQSHLASDPFLVPFIYDPNNAWNLSQEDAAIALMRQHVRTATGDVDRDGDFDCEDLNAFSSAIASGSASTAFDLNSDGVVNLSDLTTWLADAGSANLISGPSYIRGDANLDGVVDGSDFGIWNANKFTASAAYCEGDLNADGVIDGSDFGIWNAAKFMSADESGSNLIPEPSVLFPSLLTGLIWRKRVASLRR